MKTSLNGRRLITLEEGKAKWDPVKKLYFPYRDQIGKLTIGVGHLIRSDEDFGSGITEERVDQLLAADLMKCDVAIDGIKCPRPLNQNQWDCLASWLFNVGTGWARADKSSIVRAINIGEFERVPDLLMLYDVAGGKHQPFLAARRKREGKLWSTPVTQDLDEVYQLASKAASLRFDAVDLARQADDDAREDPEVEIVWEVQGDEEDTPVILPKRSTPPKP
jgi:GH24 family phage-related lysozyme (muramidase)